MIQILRVSIFFYLWLLLPHTTFGAEKISCREKKVLICGVCRDVAQSVPTTIMNIERLGRNFNDYAVIIYENNSKDATATLLKQWAEKNNKVIFMSEIRTQSQLLEGVRCHDFNGASSRMERIAYARNRLLTVAREERFDDFDYLIMADLDFNKPWSIKAIVETIEKIKDWDCITANGVLPNGNYYDKFAFRNADFPFGPELLGENWWFGIGPGSFKLEGSSLVPVYSAFGGLAIYKRKTIINFSYYGYVTDDLRADFEAILPSIPVSHPHIQKYLQMNGIAASRFPSVPIQFCNNSGYYNYPVCCEHITLHASMRRHGFGKIYINPKIRMRY